MFIFNSNTQQWMSKVDLTMSMDISFQLFSIKTLHSQNIFKKVDIELLFHLELMNSIDNKRTVRKLYQIKGQILGGGFEIEVGGVNF